VEGLDPVGDGGDALAQLGLGQVAQRHDRADRPAELAEGPVDAVAVPVGEPCIRMMSAD
jgi:hypothetical protein